MKYEDVYYFPKVRGLTRGVVLKRVCVEQNEINIFMPKKSKNLPELS